MGNAAWGHGYHTGRGEGIFSGRIEGAVGMAIVAGALFAAEKAAPYVKSKVDEWREKQLPETSHVKENPTTSAETETHFSDLEDSNHQALEAKDRPGEEKS